MFGCDYAEMIFWDYVELEYWRGLVVRIPSRLPR